MRGHSQGPVAEGRQSIVYSLWSMQRLEGSNVWRGKEVARPEGSNVGTVKDSCTRETVKRSTSLACPSPSQIAAMMPVARQPQAASAGRLT